MVFVVSSTVTVAPADNANSYISLANLTAYASALYPDITFSSYSSAQQTGAVFRAMKYIESFADRYRGQRTSDAQPLSWPRASVVVSQRTLPSDEVPDDIKEAQALTAIEILRGYDPLKSLKYEDILKSSGVLSGLQTKGFSDMYLDDYGASDRLIGVDELLEPYLLPLLTTVI